MSAKLGADFLKFGICLTPAPKSQPAFGRLQAVVVLPGQSLHSLSQNSLAGTGCRGGTNTQSQNKCS